MTLIETRNKFEKQQQSFTGIFHISKLWFENILSCDINSDLNLLFVTSVA